MRRQREAELEKERERDVFIEGVAEILSAEDADMRAARAEEKMADTGFRRLAHMVQEYAIHDSDYDRHAQANELLDAIEAGRGKRLRGSQNLRAFGLMVEMGVWDEHENLHLLRRNISTTIDDEIVQAARTICGRAWEPEPWRRDLTGPLSFSIDDASTRDIDDALSCEILPQGGFRVGVHIADPSARVPVGCELDLDARGRGTSIYLPTGNFPMFARELSHDLMSLVEGELRPAVSTLFTFTDDFELLDAEVAPSMVRVNHRLTYDQVDAMLADSADSPDSAEINDALLDALRRLEKAGHKLMQRRNEQGAVSIDLPELKMHVDCSGAEPHIVCEVLDAASRSRRIVSEWMIANNRVIGEFCREHQLPTIYRGQPSPDAELYTDDILSLPEGLAREFALVRKMKPGDASTEPMPHFGLGLSVYVQGSSPIRRYSDLVCQRQIKAFLADEALPYDPDHIVEVLGTVEVAARDAKITERETTRYWTLHHLAGLKGEALDATVVEHKDHNKALAAVFLHGVALKATCKFANRPAVGEPCQVVVSSADARKDSLYLRQA
jgi:exoribonuclease-2